MKFLLCFCLKRNPTTNSLSSTKVSYTRSSSVLPTVTSAPHSLSSDLSNESNYETFNHSATDGEIRMDDGYIVPTTSTECDGYAEIRPTRLSQPLFDDDTELYATVDKTRIAKNARRIETDDTSTIDENLPQGVLSASATISSPQPLSSSGSHLSGFAIVSEHPPLSLPVYTNRTVNTITNNQDDTSNGPQSSYDGIKRCESLQNRGHCLKREEEQTQQEQQFHENPHFYVNSARETTNSDDIYVELNNGNASDTIYHNPQSYSHSRPSNGSEIDDDLSERYATIIEVNNGEEQLTTNNIFQEITSMMF